MRAPSFRCTEKNGQLILHYYSERGGLEHIVIGIVREVASKLHGVDVDIKIIKRKGEPLDKEDDKITPNPINDNQKKIPDKPPAIKKSIVRQKIEQWEGMKNKDAHNNVNRKQAHKNKLIKNIENSYLGDKIENIITNLEIIGDNDHHHQDDVDDNNVNHNQSNSQNGCGDDRNLKNMNGADHKTEIKTEISDHFQFLITEVSGPNKTPTENVEETEVPEDFNLIAEGPLVSPATFCRVFPFHIMFNRQMVVVQAGKSVSRVIPR